MLRVYYRFRGDQPKSPSDILEGLEWFLVDTVPRKGEFVLVGGRRVHEVVGVSWFPERERHTKARVPVLILYPEPL